MDTDNPKSQTPNSEQLAEKRRVYWRAQIRRTVGLLIIWAVVGFGLSILGVEFLNGFTFNNMPFGFWMAQQGAIIVFVLLILTYAILTQRAEAE